LAKIRGLPEESNFVSLYGVDYWPKLIEGLELVVLVGEASAEDRRQSLLEFFTFEAPLIDSMMDAERFAGNTVELLEEAERAGYDGDLYAFKATKVKVRMSSSARSAKTRQDSSAEN
jgi:hypothetical protein